MTWTLVPKKTKQNARVLVLLCWDPFFSRGFVDNLSFTGPASTRKAKPQARASGRFWRWPSPPAVMDGW